MNRRVTIVLDIEPRDPGAEQLARPLRLTQVVGGRVRVERGGVWSRQLFANREQLAHALTCAAGTARDKARDCGGPATATGWHYATAAHFLADAAIACLTDKRNGDMWPSLESKLCT